MPRTAHPPARGECSFRARRRPQPTDPPQDRREPRPGHRHLRQLEGLPSEPPESEAPPGTSSSPPGRCAFMHLYGAGTWVAPGVGTWVHAGQVPVYARRSGANQRRGDAPHPVRGVVDLDLRPGLDHPHPLPRPGPARPGSVPGGSGSPRRAPPPAARPRPGTRPPAPPPAAAAGWAATGSPAARPPALRAAAPRCTPAATAPSSPRRSAPGGPAGASRPQLALRVPWDRSTLPRVCGRKGRPWIGRMPRRISRASKSLSRWAIWAPCPGLRPAYWDRL